MSDVFGRRRTPQTEIDAGVMHDALIAVVRQPGFYTKHGVADTFQGRFDLLVLLVAIVLRRLRRLGPEGQQLAQDLVDEMFRRLDIAMRELGVSDVGVPKRMKRLAEAFKGRSAAYDQALDGADAEELASAVSRNVLDGSGDGRRLADYSRVADSRFAAASLAALKAGNLPYPQLSGSEAA